MSRELNLIEAISLIVDSKDIALAEQKIQLIDWLLNEAKVKNNLHFGENEEDSNGEN